MWPIWNPKINGAQNFNQAGAHIQPIKVPTLTPYPDEAHVTQINPMWSCWLGHCKAVARVMISNPRMFFVVVRALLVDC